MPEGFVQSDESIRNLLIYSYNKNYTKVVLFRPETAERRIFMSEAAVTKNAIANGFKQLMEKKPFDKITISDITNICGLNRQTFYYHFQDKYDLLNWIFYNEAITPFNHELSFDNWSSRLLDMLTTINTNSKFYMNAMRTSYSSEFKDYMHKVSTKVFVEVIENIAGEKGIAESDKIFIAEFFSYGIIGCVVAWVNNGMKEQPEIIVSHIENLVNDCKRLAISRYMNS